MEKIVKDYFPMTKFHAMLRHLAETANSLQEIMFNFDLVALTHVFWMLDFYQNVKMYTVVRNAPVSAPPNSLAALVAPPLELSGPPEISDADKGIGKSIIENVSRLAEKLDLKTTKHRMFLFELDLRYPMTEADFKTHLKVLLEALKHDLSECRFYHYPQSKLDVLMKFYPQWNVISAAFPLAKSEALAAVDC